MCSGRFVHIFDWSIQIDQAINLLFLIFVYLHILSVLDSDDPKDKAKRFSLKADVIGDKIKFIKSNTDVDTIIFTNEDDEEIIIGVKMPIKVELKVTEAPPSIKGSTMTGGNKIATLETGGTINVPLFIEVGETIRINTETGEYVERA